MTKIKENRTVNPCFLLESIKKVEEYQYLHKNQCIMVLPLLICPNTFGKLWTFSEGSETTRYSVEDLNTGFGLMMNNNC